MRSVAVVFAVVAGCTQAPPPKCPEVPAPVATPSPAAAPVAPELDDPGVISQSHAFFAAFDQADLPTFEALVGPGFVRLARARFYDAKFFAKELAARLERGAPRASRECTEERVFRTGSAAVYVGACTVHVPAFGEMPATSIEGLDTLVWVPTGGAWKVAHWQHQLGGRDAERESWNETFRTAVHYKRTVNDFLVEIVKNRRPGTALDIATGQGRNALYLASKKWRVTGVDISDEGLRMAEEAAAAQKLRLDLVERDIAKYDLGTGKWDLVTLIYAGSDPALIKRIQASLRRGGLFVVEFFHRDATKGTGIGGFTDGELAQLFAGWKILRDEVVEDVSDWGLVKTKLVRFAAQKP